MSLKDEIYLKHILNSCQTIARYISGMSFDVFSKDEKTIDAVARQLQIIGEAANQMSKDGRSALPAIPWPDIISMRNRIIHEYFGVDLETVWSTITEDIPILKKQIISAKRETKPSP